MYKDFNSVSLLVFGFLTVCKSARILVYIPTPSISHQVVFRPLVQELANRGHEVVYITTDPYFYKLETSANITEIDLHDLSYEIWRTFYETTKGNNNDLANQLKVGLESIIKIFEKQVQTEQVQKIIQNKNDTFDLLLLESVVRSTLVFSHLFKAPVIQVSSLGALFESYNTIGSPWNPILYPSPLRQNLNNLSLWVKLKELYNYLQLEYMYNKLLTQENEMIKNNFGPNIPNLNDLRNNIHMLFLNVHPIFEGNFPVPPTVIHMGGLHQKPQKELPKNINSILDSSLHGVIYVSFGTNVKPSLLPSEKIQIMLKVFSQLRYDVLWKWDHDDLAGISKNIHISKWFPQSDLLRHPKVKLFITQGGLQSTDEAITAGVPLIGMPMLGDQWYNVEKYVHHKIGVRLDMEILTEQNFRNAINTVIEDRRYRINIVKLRTLMRDQPQPPLDRAIWWIEHVLRHGGAKHYRSPIANISWTEYLQLDIVFTLLLGLVFICISLGVSLYYLYIFLIDRYMYSIKIKVS